MNRTGRILDLKKFTVKNCSAKTGIKKAEQPYYENSTKYKGGNGTYFSNFKSESVVMMKIILYADKDHNEEIIEVNVRNEILNQNMDWTNITHDRFIKLRKKLVNSKHNFDIDKNNVITFDKDLFKL